MDTNTLKQTLLAELHKYAGEGLNAHSYVTINEDEGIYAVIDIAQVRDQQVVGAVLVVRLQNDHIYIDLDQNDKPLVDALLGRGVSPQQLTLTYQHNKVAS